ncbi:MAG: polysaccharide biosynthesis/export family protein [Gammaproteobacteria bacterium]
MRRTLSSLMLIAASLAVFADGASVTPTTPQPDHYRIQPGDVLAISVWKEEDLQGEALVQPDGGVSFPLAGEITASGKSIAELRGEIASRLEHYIPKPVVTVAVRAIGGNRIYVLGKVNKPGEFPFSKPLDVMQALSLAGGTASFAAVNDIVVLRREHGEQRAIRFRSADVERGRELAQNILLQSGDTVVVP